MKSENGQEDLPAKDISEEQGGKDKTPLREVVEKHRNAIMKMPGVVGIAVGRCQERSGNCILVYTKTGDWPDQLAKELEGHPVEAIKTGGDFRPRRK